MPVNRSTKDLFLAVDANAIIHRAFHAYPDTLVNSKGLQVNAVYGFTVMLLNALAKYSPKYIVCAFDTSKPTFRHQSFPEYKAHRKPTDHSLIAQFPLVERVLEAFNIPILKKPGYEADDILGDIANRVCDGKWADYQLNALILTGDRDLLQLINDNVHVVLPAGSFKNLIEYDQKETAKRLGVAPEQIVDYKALVGDPSDNIPGVKGIGKKGAEQLLNQYGSVDNLYKHLDEINPRYAKLLQEGVEQMELSRALAKIESDIGLDIKLEQCLLRDFNRAEVLQLFQEFEFRSLVGKIPEQSAGKSDQNGQIGLFDGGSHSGEGDSSSEGSREIITQNIADEQLAEKLSEVLGGEQPTFIYVPNAQQGLGELYFTNVDNSGQLRVWKSVVGCETTREFAIGFTSGTPRETLWLDWEQFAQDLLKFEIHALQELSIKVWDLYLASHVVSSGENLKNFGELVYKYLGMEKGDLTSVPDMVNQIHLIPQIAKALQTEMDQMKASAYSRARTESLGLGDQLVKNAYIKYEPALSVALGRMESRGIKVGVDQLQNLGKELEENLAEHEEKVYYYVGHQFNLNSPKQLSEVLYDQLALGNGGRGSRSTREEVLLKLKEAHPAIEHILKYRELSKVLGTYVKPFVDIVRDDEEDAIHTDFIQTGASSGRLASQNPNMQNLPARGEWAGKIRECFIAREGYKLLSLDYSQIELRIFADRSEDPILIQDFEAGKDIHRATAARIFDKSEDEVTSEERNIGKTLNFGILYGQSRFGVANMLNIPVDEAQKYITEYFDTYKGVKTYLTETQDNAMKLGYVQTLLGRRRYIAGLSSANQRVQSAAVREAINMPIQGTAADIMKLALVEVDRYATSQLKEGEAYALLQIHDELLFEVKESVVEQVEDQVKEIMCNCVKLNVPLVVNSTVGDNMSELK